MMKFSKVFPFVIFGALAVMLLQTTLKQRAGANHVDHPAVAKFTEANFEAEVLNSEKPVLVDFWAEWCGPCLTMAPTISEIAVEYEGKAVVGKLNVDDNQTLAQKYQINSIPYFAVLKNGEIVESHIGTTSKANLTRLIEKHLIEE